MPERNLARSSLPAPMLISDNLEPTQSMVDGQYYTSKAALRSTYLPSGNKEGARFVEIGGDAAITKPSPKPKPDRNAVKAAVGKAFSQAGLGA